PPALTGREREIKHTHSLIDNLSAGGFENHMLISGVRGVGKTVLLLKFEELASAKGWQAKTHEVARTTLLPNVIAKIARETLIAISGKARMRKRVNRALGILKAFTLCIGDIQLKIDVETVSGIADSGDFQEDLKDLLVEVGEVARE